MSEHTTTGKWKIATFPKTGWWVVDINDYGSPCVTCEMCEVVTIRYGHTIRNNNYPSELEVGCICCGWLTGDMLGAEDRERFMRSRSAQRTRWLTRAWKLSKKGNHWIVAHDHRVVVWERVLPPGVVTVGHNGQHLKGRTYGFLVSSLVDDFNVYHKGGYASLSDAKLVAFDTVTKRLVTSHVEELTDFEDDADSEDEHADSEDNS